jgi:molecular chaperone HtpG
MKQDQSAKKYKFKAEVKQLLDILVHSLYTSREIFLRELISNSSDALDKLRFEITRGTEVKDKEIPLEIRISFDEKENTVTITDTGIGMSRDEIISNIGTIAKSGSADFIKKLSEDKAEANNIIGKFGVGFYSVFMAAKEVVVKSRSYLPGETPVEWRSDGLGSYEIVETDEDLKRGTTIIIHLKEDAKEFADKYRLSGIIKKYSNFIIFPIYINEERINTVSAIWREPRTSVKQEQYNEFYKFLTYDEEAPFSVVHTSVDAPIQFYTLLFIPPKSIEMFRFTREDYGLDLYVRKVLIQHKSKDILPEYLSFIRGVVDSEDLPLNISRETLQENIIFTKISQSVTSQVLSHLLKMAKEDPERYKLFWKEHGRYFKLGYTDFANQEKFMQLLRFNSSVSGKEEDVISLEEYTTRMKEGQKEIYYASGGSRDAINLDPHLEIFRNKGIEVLYLYDPVDEFVISTLRKFREFELRTVDSVDLKALENFNDVKEREKTEGLTSDDEKHFDSLLAKIKEILGDKVTDVKVSSRLIDSPSCLVNPDDGISAQMQKLFRMTNQDMGPQKKLFEVNKDHKLIRNLLKIYKSDANDEYIKDAVEQLYESALLLEGNLLDPHRLVSRISKMLESSSEWYVNTKNIKKE